MAGGRSLRRRGFRPFHGPPYPRRGRALGEHVRQGVSGRESLYPTFPSGRTPGQEGPPDGGRTHPDLLRQPGQGSIPGRILFPYGSGAPEHRGESCPAVGGNIGDIIVWILVTKT